MKKTSPSELLVGASTIGGSHLWEGRPNQDAVRVRRYGYGCVAAVADGVGSQRFSQYGSQAAVQAVHEVFCAYVRGDVRREHITRTITRWYAQRVKEKYRAQADTTCLFAAHIYGQGLFLGQIGDGICCGFLNGTPFLLREKEEEFGNLVVPLSPGRPTAVWRTRFIPGQQLRSLELLLATDGVSGDLLPGKEAAFTRYLMDRTIGQGQRAGEENLIRLLENWESPLSLDDKTIALYRCTAERRKTYEQCCV